MDVEGALKTLAQIPVSVHCWQGDDVRGLEGGGRELSGGIQTTGNYPGRARNFEELTADFVKAMELVPGKKRISLHASYACFGEGEQVGRDQLQPRHFDPWIAFARQNGLGIDFNPTFFSHPMVKDNLTLSSPEGRCAGSGCATASSAGGSAPISPENLGARCCAMCGFPTATRMCPPTAWGPGCV